MTLSFTHFAQCLGNIDLGFYGLGFRCREGAFIVISLHGKCNCESRV